MIQSTLPGLSDAEKIVQPFQFPAHSAYEYRVTALRECPLPEAQFLCDTPERAEEYWRAQIPAHPHFNPEVECLVVLVLNTRRRVKGHYLVSVGIQDTLLVHPREIFRVAVMTSAAAIIIVHNHPSGDPSPSGADIKVTRDMARVGQLMKIEVLDHIIIGAAGGSPSHQSLRAMGYFTANDSQY